jgi:hypothetical protein
MEHLSAVAEGRFEALMWARRGILKHHVGQRLNRIELNAFIQVYVIVALTFPR